MVALLLRCTPSKEKATFLRRLTRLYRTVLPPNKGTLIPFRRAGNVTGMFKVHRVTQRYAGLIGGGIKIRGWSFRRLGSDQAADSARTTTNETE